MFAAFRVKRGHDSNRETSWTVAARFREKRGFETTKAGRNKEKNRYSREGR